MITFIIDYSTSPEGIGQVYDANKLLNIIDFKPNLDDVGEEAYNGIMNAGNIIANDRKHLLNILRGLNVTHVEDDELCQEKVFNLEEWISIIG